MYVWQFQMGLEYTIVGRTWEEFLKICQQICSQLRDNERLSILEDPEFLPISRMHSRLQLQSVQSSLIQREQQQLLSRQSLMVKQNGMAIQMLLVQQELRKRFLVEYQK